MSTVWTIVIAILAFTAMIFVHELGHFMFAKLFKIQVHEFALGMGPAIFKKKIGETLYSIRCVPFGGFCSMDAEDETSASPRAFRNVAKWKRAVVLSAGAVFNIIFGFILFVIIVGSANTVKVPVVDSYISGSYIEEAGIIDGDRIIALDGTAINIYDDFSFFMDRIDGSKAIDVTVQRGDTSYTFSVKPTKSENVFHINKDDVTVKSYINGQVTETQTISRDRINAPDAKVGDVITQSRYLLGFTPREEPNSFGATIHEAFYSTLFNGKVVYISLYELITGKVPANQVMGAIGIIDTMGAAARAGWKVLFSLLALISINLGIMNLLPIPAMDGGRLLFLLIEAIIRKRIPPEKEGIVHLIGFILLIALMILLAFNDIMRLFGL